MVATGASFLSHRRRDFMTKMRDVLTLVHDQRATSHKIALSLEQVKVRKIWVKMDAYFKVTSVS